MESRSSIPNSAYGILQQDEFGLEIEEVAEQVRRLGYAILDSGYSAKQLNIISTAFDRTRESYIKHWNKSRLEELDELYTIRALPTHGGIPFLELAQNHNLLSVLRKLIAGAFILNQQNGIINPAGKPYNQGSWHRDLPYQHYISSSPLAINALFCLDDFSFENGSTFLLPASHKAAAFPSERYRDKNAIQIEAKAGQFILLDCMLFHSGGFNRTNRDRRAVNHIYNIPYFKQQISLPKNMCADDLSVEGRKLFGFGCQEAESIEAYLASRIMNAST